MSMLPAQQGCEAMDKSEDAFRTISEAAEELDLPQHVLRFWETRFPQIRPLKRGGGRRYYRPDDVQLLRAIRHLLYSDGYTIKGVQRMLKERGVRAVLAMCEAPAAGAQAPSVAALAPAPRVEAVAPAPLAPPPRLLVDVEAAHGEPGARDLDLPGLLVAVEPAPAGPRVAPPPPAPRRFSADERRKLEAVAAELAECRRILLAAAI